MRIVQAAVMMMLLAAHPVSAQSSSPMRLTLREAENMALRSADALRIQELQGEAAEERYRRGFRDYLPQLQLGFTTTGTVNVAAPDTACDELSVTLQQPIYNGGRSATQRALARLQIQLSRHAYRVARAETLASAWDRYYRVLVLEAQLAVKQRYLAQSRRELEIARTERVLGMIREIDLVDTELQATSQEIDVSATESDLVSARYELKKLLGLSTDRELALSETIDTSYEGMAIDEALASLLRVAERGNLDLQTARFRVSQAEAQASFARSRYLPRVSASLTLSVSGQGLPLQTPGMSLGLAIAFPESEVPASTSLSQGVIASQSATRNAALTLSPFQSIVGFLDEADARLELETARSSAASLRKDIAFQIAQGIAGNRRQRATIQLERRSVELERKKLEVMRREVESGAATRVDYVKEEAIAADREAQLLASLLTLLRGERAIERLLGLDPGELPQIAGDTGGTK